MDVFWAFVETNYSNSPVPCSICICRKLLRPLCAAAHRRLAICYHCREPCGPCCTRQRDYSFGEYDGCPSDQPELAWDRDRSKSRYCHLSAHPGGVQQSGNGACDHRTRVLPRNQVSDRHRDLGRHQEDRHDDLSCCMHMQDGSEKRQYGRCRPSSKSLWCYRPARGRCQCLSDSTSWSSSGDSLCVLLPFCCLSEVNCNH